MNIAQPVAFAQAVASGEDAGVATIVAVVTALLGLLAGVGIVVRALLGLAGDDGDDAGDDGGGDPAGGGRCRAARPRRRRTGGPSSSASSPTTSAPIHANGGSKRGPSDGTIRRRGPQGGPRPFRRGRGPRRGQCRRGP